MQQYGQVLKSSGGKAQVQIRRHLQCEKCSHCSGEREHLIEAKNPINAKAGQVVRLEMGSGMVLKATFLLYIFPLLMMLLGYLLGSSLFSAAEELVGFLTGMTFLGLSFLLIRFLDGYLGRRWELIPTIKQIMVVQGVMKANDQGFSSIRKR